MKKLLKKLGLFLIGKSNVYTTTTEDGEYIILTDQPLSDYVQKEISKILKSEYTNIKIKDALLDTIEKHKGTVEQGKCFLAAKDFVLGLDKEGKIVPVVDCDGNRVKALELTEDLKDEISSSNYEATLNRLNQYKAEIKK